MATARSILICGCCWITRICAATCYKTANHKLYKA